MARIKPVMDAHFIWKLERLLSTGWIKESDNQLITFECLLNNFYFFEILDCCQAEEGYASLWRRYAIWSASKVLFLVTDERIIDAFNVLNSYAAGSATLNELKKAYRSADRDWEAILEINESNPNFPAIAEASRAIFHASCPFLHDPFMCLPVIGSAAHAAFVNSVACAILALAEHAVDNFDGSDLKINEKDEARRTVISNIFAKAFRELVTTGTLPSDSDKFISKMFSGCSSIQTIPEILGTVSSEVNISELFHSSSFIQTIPPFH